MKLSVVGTVCFLINGFPLVSAIRGDRLLGKNDACTTESFCKIEMLEDGACKVGDTVTKKCENGVEVSIVVTGTKADGGCEPSQFTWISPLQMDSIVLKAGNKLEPSGADNKTNGEVNVVGQSAISHIQFCFSDQQDAPAAPIKQPSSSSPTKSPTTNAPSDSPTSAPSAAVPASIDVKNTVYVGDDDNGSGCSTATKSIAAMTGTKITYCFTVTNTGNLPLAEVLLKNTDLDFSDDSVGTLQPGVSATVYFPATIGGDKTNEVAATGIPKSKTGDTLPGRGDVIAKDTSEVNVIKPVPSVSITNTGYVGDDIGVSCGIKDKPMIQAKTGDDIVFCLNVQNTGNTALINSVIEIPSTGFKSNALGTLAPGESEEVVYPYEGVDTLMDAMAIVTANPTMPDGSSMADQVKDDSTATVVVADVKSGSKPTLGKCIETNWKNAGNEEELMCATRDIIFLESGASDKPVQCSVGDKVKVTVDGSIRFKDSTPRYDVAWYVATDGGDAMTGTCALTALGKGTDYSIVQSSGSDKVVGSVVWDAANAGDSDACGDVVISNGTGGANLDMPLVFDLELPCKDENDDGLLDFAVCFTWRQDSNNDVCSFEAVIPGSSTTGCYCTRVDISNTEVDVPKNDPAQACS